MTRELRDVKDYLRVLRSTALRMGKYELAVAIFLCLDRIALVERKLKESVEEAMSDDSGARPG